MGETQLVVTAHQHNDIPKEYHDVDTPGHYEIENTLAKLNRQIYWPAIRSTVKEYVKPCAKCQII